MAARVITKLPFYTSSSIFQNKLKWEKLSFRRQKQKALVMYKSMHNETCPGILTNVFLLNATLSIIWESRGKTCFAQAAYELSKKKVFVEVGPIHELHVLTVSVNDASSRYLTDRIPARTVACKAFQTSFLF